MIPIVIDMIRHRFRSNFRKGIVTMNRYSLLRVAVVSLAWISTTGLLARTSRPPMPASPTSLPSGAGRPAKLIVLCASDTTNAKLEKMAAALGAMQGVIRSSAHPDEKCVSIVADIDSAVTIDRAMRYLELAGYEAKEADDATTDRVAAAVRTAGAKASGAACSSTPATGAVDAQNKELAKLIDLTNSLNALQERFNAEKDRPRIVALLSPL